jgi:hypothetical protein
MLPIIFVIGGIIYGWGIWKFVQGFRHTNYAKGSAFPLALAWPILLVGNRSFRNNFQKALRGRG